MHSSMARAEDFEQCFYICPNLSLRGSSLGGKDGGHLGVFVAHEPVLQYQILLLERYVFSEDPLGSLSRARERFFPRYKVDWPLILDNRWARLIRDLRCLKLNSFGDNYGYVFDYGSKFNHDCNPNAGRVNWEDGINAVIALRDIPVGYEVTISYTKCDPAASAHQRRMDIYTKQSFWCECLRCSNDQGLGERPMPTTAEEASLQPAELAVRRLCAMPDSAVPEKLKFSHAVVLSKQCVQEGKKKEFIPYFEEAMKTAKLSKNRGYCTTETLQTALYPQALKGDEALIDVQSVMKPIWNCYNAMVMVVPLGCLYMSFKHALSPGLGSLLSIAAAVGTLYVLFSRDCIWVLWGVDGLEAHLRQLGRKREQAMRAKRQEMGKTEKRKLVVPKNTKSKAASKSGFVNAVLEDPPTFWS